MRKALLYIQLFIVICIITERNIYAQYTASDFNLKLNETTTERFDKASAEIYNPANFVLADSLMKLGTAQKDSDIIIAGMLLKTFPYMAISDAENGIKTSIEVQKYTANAKYRFAYFVCSQMEVIFRVMKNDYYGSINKAQTMSNEAVNSNYIEGIHMGYYAMGLAFMLRNNPQVASTHFQQAANSMTARNVDDRFTWPIFLQLAKCHEMMQEYDKSEIYAIMAEDAARRCGNTLVANRVKAARLTICYHLMSDKQFIQVVDNAKSNRTYDGYLTTEDRYIVESQYLARKNEKEKAIAIADSMGINIESLTNKEHLYNYFGDVENAYKCRIKRDEINDSLAAVIQTEDIAAINGKMNNTSLKLLTEELNTEKRYIIQGGAAIITLLILIFVLVSNINRRKRLAKERDILEEEVNRQTSELQNLVSVINQKNSDITDSIRYAQRIQKAILPDLTQFIGHGIKGAFTYFKPYNIVSGDFYWANKKGNKMMIACSDCTGHGVPGGFMSMIGSTLLSDITETHPNYTASEILKELDAQLITLLGQNDSNISEGMDLALIIFDTETKEINCSAARRPIYVIHDNELTEINGIKRSIGERDEISRKLEFCDHSLKINEGDTLYLYTDGITDQFGGQEMHGENGKRLSKSGVKKLLKDICTLNMEEQKNAFKNALEQWQGTCNQIDDMTFIAIHF